MFNLTCFELQKLSLNRWQLATRSVGVRKGCTKDDSRTWSLSQANSIPRAAEYEAGTRCWPAHFNVTRTWSFLEVLMITILLQPDHEMGTSGSIRSDHGPLSYRHTWLNLPVFMRTAHSCHWNIHKYRGRGGKTFSDIHLYFLGKHIWSSLNRKIDTPQREGLPTTLPQTEPRQIN
jgi:hypothetical protein